MLEQSKLVRQLSQTEQQDLILEMNMFNDQWTPHSAPTALQYGKTIYLQQISDTDKSHKVKFSKFDKCVKTYSILQNIACGNKIARCYWHKLMPGDKINRHDDRDLPFVKNGMLEHRYQIYLDSDPNFLLELDNTLVPTSLWEYSVVDFALEKSHFYQNNSTKPWIFLVFDVFHSNI